MWQSGMLEITGANELSNPEKYQDHFYSNVTDK